MKRGLNEWNEMISGNDSEYSNNSKELAIKICQRYDPFSSFILRII